MAKKKKKKDVDIVNINEVTKELEKLNEMTSLKPIEVDETENENKSVDELSHADYKVQRRSGNIPKK